MSRAAITVRKLARETGRDPDDVAHILRQAGILVSSAHHQVPRSKLGLARRTLGLGRQPSVSAPVEPRGTDPRVRSPSAAAERSRARPATRLAAPRWPRPKHEFINYLAVPDVLAIHDALVEEFRGTADAVEPPGVKNQGALEGSVKRAQTAHQLYSTVLLAGAALVHSLNCNHAFHNGNKRTSLLALAIFLEERNGRYIMGSEDDLFDLIVGIARHGLVPPDETPGKESDPYYADREVLEVHRLLRAMVAVPTRSDKSLKWHDFARLLERFDCEVSSIASNQAKIRRQLSDGRVLTAVAGARNLGTEISGRQIRQYRKQLELTDDFGIDSSIFYDGRQPHPDLPQLIRRYRGVLERLSFLDRSAPI